MRNYLPVTGLVYIVLQDLLWLLLDAGCDHLVQAVVDLLDSPGRAAMAATCLAWQQYLAVQYRGTAGVRGAWLAGPTRQAAPHTIAGVTAEHKKTSFCH